MKDFKISILGAEWSVLFRAELEDKMLENVTDTQTGQIIQSLLLLKIVMILIALKILMNYKRKPQDMRLFMPFCLRVDLDLT